MKVVISTNAECDLVEIADWISEDNPAAAVSLLKRLRDCCMTLGDFPERFRRVHGAVRLRPVAAYAIFYDVGEDRVDVLRVLHGARDYAGLFGPHH
jgi:toxin ParE1/3/4